MQVNNWPVPLLGLDWRFWGYFKYYIEMLTPPKMLGCFAVCCNAADITNSFGQVKAVMHSYCVTAV